MGRCVLAGSAAAAALLGAASGEFRYPWGEEVRWGRVCVSDFLNHRIQYFRESRPVVESDSLGRVRALFK